MIKSNYGGVSLLNFVTAINGNLITFSTTRVTMPVQTYRICEVGIWENQQNSRIQQTLENLEIF